MADQTTESRSSGFTTVLERWFEAALWNARILVVVGVLVAAISAVFIFACTVFLGIEIAQQSLLFMAGDHSAQRVNTMMLSIIKLIDQMLIGAILFIVAFGLYELFISDISAARYAENKGRILSVPDVDALKSKLGKLVLMFLIVTYFRHALNVEAGTPLDMLMLAGGIGIIALALFLTHHGEAKSSPDSGVTE